MKIKRKNNSLYPKSFPLREKGKIKNKEKYFMIPCQARNDSKFVLYCHSELASESLKVYSFKKISCFPSTPKERYVGWGIKINLKFNI